MERAGRLSWTQQRGALAAAAAAALLLAGCGAEGGEPSSSGPPSAGIGPGISVGEAKSSATDELVLVRGALVIEDGLTWLCDALAESYPPRCGGDKLRVEGVDRAELELTTANGVEFSENVRLLGVIDGDVLRISQTATG